jgi:twinkle protein
MTTRPEQEAGITYEQLGIHIRNPNGGGNRKAKCPQPACANRRNQADYSLSVLLDTGEWRCHHCGWDSGLGKEARARGVPALDRPAPQVQAPPRPPSKPRPMPGILEDWATTWFAERGISKQTVQRLGVEARETGSGEQRQQVVYFPYTVDGQLVNIKRRVLPKRWAQEPGAMRSLFNLDSVPVGAEDLVLVEGELDVLAVEELAAGWHVVSLPDGAPGPGQKADGKLAALDEPRAAAMLAQVRRVLIATDMDEPGKALADALVAKLGPDRCWRVQWPAGCKDANDVLLRHGAAGVDRALADAQPVPLPGVQSFADYGAKLHHIYRNGMERGCSTGIAAVDRLYTPAPGGITAITGIPSHGKSTWCDNLMVNLAGACGWRFGICTPEKQPPEWHMAQLLAIANNRPFFDGPTERMPEEALDYGVSWVAEHWTPIMPEEPTVEKVLSAAQALVARHGIKGLVIDPWAQLEVSRPSRMTETEYVAQVLRQLRTWASRHRVHVFIVVHPSKLQIIPGKKQPVPTGYDCAGSAHWYNLTDHGITIWRDIERPGDPVLCKVWKARWRHLGQIGEAWMQYHPATDRYTSHDEAIASEHLTRVPAVEQAEDILRDAQAEQPFE